MRVFVALELPSLFEDEVAALACHLKPLVAGRFMKRETYHLTLAFLGEVGEVAARDAMAALDVACKDRAPVPLSPDGLGKFGRPVDATLWLGIAPAPELMALAEAVRADLAARALAFDEKPFRPHITFARRARLPHGALPELVFPQPAHATRVALFKSTLSQEGATYKELYHVELS